jgi:hypothetical protein
LKDFNRLHYSTKEGLLETLTMSLVTKWTIAILIKVPLIFILALGFVSGMAIVLQNISLALSIAGAAIMLICCVFTIEIFADLAKLVEDTSKKQNQNS